MLKEKILIADDDLDILDVIRITLETEGYQVVEAHDGKEAIEIVKSRNPDIVVLDYMMPGMNGRQFLTELRPRRRRQLVQMCAQLVNSSDVSRSSIVRLLAQLRETLRKPALLRQQAPQLNHKIAGEIRAARQEVGLRS